MNKFPKDQTLGNKDRTEKDAGLNKDKSGLGHKVPPTGGSTIQKDRTMGGGIGKADQSQNKWNDKDKR